MKKVLFIDRDGTIISETADEQIDSFEKLSFLPNAIQNLAKIAKTMDYELVMVTNQDGLGTDAFPETDFWPVQYFIIDTLKNEGIVFKAIYIDRSFPKDNLPTRKPGTALLSSYFSAEYDLQNSFVLGDRLTDMELAKNLGCKGIFINHGTNLGAGETSATEKEIVNVIDLETNSWDEIYSFLSKLGRKGKIIRNTNETKINVELDLDGTGETEINTGIPFFDHMLDQLGRHGQMDLKVQVAGDLEIDEHHTIEDTALALGSAFKNAVGKKLGIERYGFSLPMDDCKADVAIDFGGRPWLVWEADFRREKIGDMPTEMFMHFFKSFSDEAKCNLNIKAEGDNEHHKIEAIFKAFARAIKMAKTRDVKSMQLPSTKGML